MTMRPALGSCRRSIRSASVDLPAPLGPTSATNSPLRISRLTCSSAGRASYANDTPWRLRLRSKVDFDVFPSVTCGCSANSPSIRSNAALVASTHSAVVARLLIGVISNLPTYVNRMRPWTVINPACTCAMAIRKMPSTASESTIERAGASSFSTRAARSSACSTESSAARSFVSSKCSEPKDLATRMLENVSCRDVSRLADASVCS